MPFPAIPVRHEGHNVIAVMPMDAMNGGTFAVMGRMISPVHTWYTTWTCTVNAPGAMPVWTAPKRRVAVNGVDEAVAYDRAVRDMTDRVRTANDGAPPAV